MIYLWLYRFPRSVFEQADTERMRFLSLQRNDITQTLCDSPAQLRCRNNKGMPKNKRRTDFPSQQTLETIKPLHCILALFRSLADTFCRCDIAYTQAFSHSSVYRERHGELLQSIPLPCSRPLAHRDRSDTSCQGRVSQIRCLSQLQAKAVPLPF